VGSYHRGMALLERDSQLRAAAGWLAEAAAGHGRLVFVAGEAGVGKSAFVQRVAAAAAASARAATVHREAHGLVADEIYQVQEGD
jgi:MoxR-like ATPase